MNDNISDSAQTGGTAGTGTCKKKKIRVLIEDKTDIWRYFNKLDLSKPKHKKGIKTCGHIINTDGSSVNFGIRISTCISKTVGKNPKRKQECDEALAEFLIDDVQPLYTLKSESFIN
ncbi:hypothetical protein RCL_jg17708.t1 [Rhizophagus clarus]|uniref:Uncharacterized protein n=1 Tax=Rhizophagus clarus TaxID=94130 RepID=A0A8H3L7Q5_9GLOM|nr:hypothetical protein RCL_jg17708.t1 [Rhizophagus clarus]